VAAQTTLPAGTTNQPTSVKVGALTSPGNPHPTLGLAVVQLDGNGTWEFSPNGLTWKPFGSVSRSQARLLAPGFRVRFVPAAHSNSGQADLFWFTWNGTQGKPGTVTSITATGAGTPFSAHADLATLPINDAPTWTRSHAALTSVSAVDTNPPGQTVAASFGSLFRELDGDPVGIAVTGLTGTSSGSWQFSTDGGTTWTDFNTSTGSASLSTARLLSATDMIRFVPKAGFTGTVALQAHAWDQTSGTVGGTANLKGRGKTGGATAFSTSLVTATCRVL
jgi:hypothetical protein